MSHLEESFLIYFSKMRFQKIKYKKIFLNNNRILNMTFSKNLNT